MRYPEVSLSRPCLLLLEGRVLVGREKVTKLIKLELGLTKTRLFDVNWTVAATNLIPAPYILTFLRVRERMNLITKKYGSLSDSDTVKIRLFLRLWLMSVWLCVLTSANFMRWIRSRLPSLAVENLRNVIESMTISQSWKIIFPSITVLQISLQNCSWNVLNVSFYHHVHLRYSNPCFLDCEQLMLAACCQHIRHINTIVTFQHIRHVNTSTQHTATPIRHQHINNAINASTHQHIDTTCHQHNVINTVSTHQHINTSTHIHHQHINTSTHLHNHQHINTIINTSAHQHVNTRINSMSSRHINNTVINASTHQQFGFLLCCFLAFLPPDQHTCIITHQHINTSAAINQHIITISPTQHSHQHSHDLQQKQWKSPKFHRNSPQFAQEMSRDYIKSPEILF
jgi:hypothetical protein